MITILFDYLQKWEIKLVNKLNSPKGQIVSFVAILLFGTVCRVLHYGLNYGYYHRDENTYLYRIAVADKFGMSYSGSIYFLIFTGTLFPPECVEPGLRCCSLIYSIAGMILMYFLLSRVFSSRQWGLAGMFVMALNPYLIRNSMSVLREPFYILVFITVLYLCVCYVQRKLNSDVAALLCAVLSCLGLWSRWEGVELMMFFPFALIYSKTVMRIAWKKVLRAGTIYAVMLGLSFCILLFSFPSLLSRMMEKIIINVL